MATSGRTDKDDGAMDPPHWDPSHLNPPLSGDIVPGQQGQTSIVQLLLRNRSVFWGGLLLLLMVAIAVIWPNFTIAPTEQNVMNRLQPPSSASWFGTDFLGRDVFVRVIHGARVSLVIGLVVAVIATIVGLVTGLLAGYVRALDAIIMRIMDGLMAIPAILLAIALISISGATLATVIIAITI
ncbi:MAG: ABC transporter permease, partial [Geminicoccaceae bacterium]